MLTFTKFPKKGRLGNQLFQYAAMIGFANKYKTNFVLPAWPYAKYFNEPFAELTSMGPATHIKEAAYNYTGEYYDAVMSHYNKLHNYDFDGYFQTEKYWQHCVPEVLQALTFKTEYRDAVAKKYHQVLKGKENRVIAVSIRRGDFVNNPNYAQIPITYYYTALEKYFPGWQTEDYRVIIFSDDIEYCKLHFQSFGNVFFAENSFDNTNKAMYFEENRSAIEQLCLMTLCDHFIISNSTFSWWGAYLGETSKSQIIHPRAILDGKLKAKNDTKDYFPSRWQAHEETKIDLRDVTFMVPVHYDHRDRMQNMSLNICYIQKNFNTNIIIGEQGSDIFSRFQDFGCRYVKYNYKLFHRTKMLNEMAYISNTSIIVNWDADVFISPLQILQSVEALRSGMFDVIYPYDGRFARVPRLQYFKVLEQSFDVGVFAAHKFNGTLPGHKLSVGGAVMFNRSKYFQGGGENENFVAYGPEDVEREVRFTRLGYKVGRTDGILFHMDHFKGPNSKCAGNPYDKQNHDELEKIYSFTREELRDYVNSWNLTKQYLNA